MKGGEIWVGEVIAERLLTASIERLTSDLTADIDWPMLQLAPESATVIVAEIGRKRTRCNMQARTLHEVSNLL